MEIMSVKCTLILSTFAENKRIETIKQRKDVLKDRNSSELSLNDVEYLSLYRIAPRQVCWRESKHENAFCVR